MINPKKELFIWGPIDGAWHYPSYWALCYVDQFPRTYGVRWPEALFSFNYHKMIYICEYEALRKAGWRVCERWVLPDVKYCLVRRRFDRVVKQLSILNKEINLRQAQGILREGAAKLYRAWKKVYFEFWNHGTVPELANWGGEKFLIDALKKRGLQGQENLNALEVLSAPAELGFFQEAERDLLTIALKCHPHELPRSLTKAGSLAMTLLRKHAQNYFWLYNSYYGSKVLNERDFAKMLKEEIAKGDMRGRLQEIENRVKKRRQEKETMILKLGLSRFEANVVRKLGQTISWQDERKKYVWQSNHAIDIWLREVARRAKVPFALCKDLLPNEVEQILEGGNIDVRRLAKERLVSVIHFTKYWKWEVAIDSQARRILAPFEERGERGVEEVHGLMVSKGPKVRGRVRIIFSPAKERARMKKGEILVAGMTSPDYIVVMKKAAAIITDAGGMTSHAAIVSRELGLPCIVGTKIATKVFKDGDMVEVDTERGIVRKL